MSNAHLAIVLHAHLPYVHHPEHADFLEEDWFYEAIAESYAPLLLTFLELRDEGVPFRITMSLTPTLLEMFDNPLLQRRCAAWLEKRLRLAETEARHHERSDAERQVALHYHGRFEQVRALLKRNQNNLIPAFRDLQESGHLEVLACAATHGYLPLMITPNAVRAQIEIGARTVQRHMGRRPRGIWLPECAYRPGVDDALADEGIEYFITDAHGLLNAHPAPPNGVHAPVQCPSGVAAFGRDLESSKQVWSSKEGYPGDGAYREFYRDLGYDAAYDYIKPYLHDDGVRRNLGLKYHRVTGPVELHQKQLYDRQVAVDRAREHAGHFVFCRQHQARFLKTRISAAPIVLAPYDAELYGHWWYEGPEFLGQLFRSAQFVRQDFVVSTLAEYLDQHPPAHVATPSSSSWGDKGYFEVWLNGANDWIYRHLHMAEQKMAALARTNDPKEITRAAREALNQAGRELMLAQASDWAFLMTTGTATPYAEKRTRDHLHRFTKIAQMVESGKIDSGYIRRCLESNPIFPDMDYSVYL